MQPQDVALLYLLFSQFIDQLSGSRCFTYWICWRLFLTHSLLSSSFLRTPGVLAEAFLLLALRHFEADSLVAECSDSASAAPAFPALMVALLYLTSPDEARRMTARSGVGRARREGPREAGTAAGGEQGGEGGREGLGQGGGEEPGTSSESTTLKVLESQDSFTYRVSLSSESGNGAAPSRCFT